MRSQSFVSRASAGSAIGDSDLCPVRTNDAQRTAKRAPFDAVRDFAPVTQLTQSPNVILVSVSFAGQTMKDLVDICKAHNVPVGHPHVDADNVERVLSEGYTWLMPSPVTSHPGLAKGRQLAGR